MNANESCMYPPVDTLLEKYYLSTAYSCEFILGIIGNGIVMFGYIFCMKQWSSGSIYLFNLCLSDFAFLCTLPLLVESYANESWSYGSILCQGNRYLLHANLYTSILFLTFISIDRYMLMKHPFREHRMQKRSTAVLISVAIWIVVMLELSPILIFIDLDSSDLCLSYGSSGVASQSLIYSLCLTFTGFVLPLITMCYFYFKLVHFLRNRNEQVPSSFSIEKPLTLVALAVVVFSVLFTPYHIMRNLRIASRANSWAHSGCSQMVINAIYIISRPLAFLNSVINPIFYFLMGDHFRELLFAKIQQLFKTMKSKCTLNCRHSSS